MIAKTKPPQLKIVLDTNCLYTQVASDLLRKETADTIKQHGSYPDLAISWHIPNVVRDERQFQMEQKAFELLPSIGRIEKIIGVNLNITKDILGTRIKEIIDRQVEELKLNVVAIDTTKIGWPDLIRRATFRLPPFETGEKEKGFRDALIVETLFQLINDSPTTPSICKIAFVTEDQRLTDAVIERMGELQNVRVLKSLEEVKALINTLISTVSEDFVKEIQKVATAYFFEPKNESTLYYRENVGSMISSKFKGELVVVPSGATTREDGTWYINGPSFVKKAGTRIHWGTRVTVEFKAYAQEPYKSPDEGNSTLWNTTAAPPGVVPMGSLLTPATPPATYASPSYYPAALRSLFSTLGEKKLKYNGKTIFEIAWSVTVNHNRKLKGGSIDDIKYVGTITTDA